MSERLRLDLVIQRELRRWRGDYMTGGRRIAQAVEAAIVRDGLPPDGTPGTFIGFDAEGRPNVIWWSEEPNIKHWVGVGRDPAPPHYPIAFVLKDEQAGRIVRHAVQVEPVEKLPPELDRDLVPT